jgi:hypothetical protein
MAFEFLFLLGLVGTGSRWRAGIGYLPAGHSAALKTGKTGVLGADGEPDKDVDGRQLTEAEKAAIAKKDQEMRDKELGVKSKSGEVTSKSRNPDKEGFYRGSAVIPVLKRNNNQDGSLVTGEDERKGYIKGDFLIESTGEVSHIPSGLLVYKFSDRKVAREGVDMMIDTNLSAELPSAFPRRDQKVAPVAKTLPAKFREIENRVEERNYYVNILKRMAPKGSKVKADRTGYSVSIGGETKTFKTADEAGKFLDNL